MSRFEKAWDPDSLNEDPEDDQVDPSARVSVGTWSTSQDVYVAAPTKICGSCGAIINPVTYECRC